MISRIGEFTLRPPEPADIEALYRYKNDPDIAGRLVGFSTGYSKSDLAHWVEFHRKCQDEVLWVIATEKNHCIGHVGLYRIDHRIGCAEFGIMIGDRSYHGRGLGRACTQFAVDYGFRELNLNRIDLRVLATNTAAIHLYRSLGFEQEAQLRQAQYKSGVYVDILIMGMLREDYFARDAEAKRQTEVRSVAIESSGS